MEDGFEVLKTLGAQRIHENTHIARLTIEHILNKNFTSLTKVQFSGFISILEREYSLDLTSLKDEFEQSKPSVSLEQEETVVLSASKKSNTKYTIIGISTLVLLLLFFILRSDSQEDEQSEIEINNTAINQIKDKIQEPNISEDALVVTDQEIQNLDSVQEPILPTKLILKPRSKLWVGMVNLSDFKKSQKITKDEIVFSGDDAWLIVLGHGNVDFQLGDELIEYKETKKMRLLYENGALEKISKSEFKNRNRGKNW